VSLNNEAITDVRVHILGRAVDLLSQNGVSFGIDIMSVDVTCWQVPTEMGPRPGWVIIYQAKGKLIGSENYIMQMTIITDPFISDENLKEALHNGCQMILNEKVKQGSILNGNGKDHK
jgi:hypothetical protein